MNRDELVELYYREAKTLEEIGNIYGITRERIRQKMEKFNLPRIKHRKPYKSHPISLSEYFNYVKETGREIQYLLKTILLSSKKQCEECGSKINLHIHHLVYPALSLDDVQLLCVSCHIAKHKKGIGRMKQLEICSQYLNGKNGVELASKYEIHPTRIYFILKKWTVKIRPRTTLSLEERKKRRKEYERRYYQGHKEERKIYDRQRYWNKKLALIN